MQQTFNTALLYCPLLSSIGLDCILDWITVTATLNHLTTPSGLEVLETAAYFMVCPRGFTERVLVSTKDETGRRVLRPMHSGDSNAVNRRAAAQELLTRSNNAGLCLVYGTEPVTTEETTLIQRRVGRVIYLDAVRWTDLRPSDVLHSTQIYTTASSLMSTRVTSPAHRLGHVKVNGTCLPG